MRTRTLVLVLGATSLAGQVCWSRLTAAVVGGTLAAWAITLFGAMAGWSLGAAVAGVLSRSGDLRRRLLVIVVACGIALMALPFLILQIGRLEGMPIARGVLTAILLASAHLPFGAFLPTVVAWRVESKHLATRGGELYALGSLGAVAGALLAGEILAGVIALDHLGVLLGAVTIASLVLVGRGRERRPDPSAGSQAPLPRMLVLAAFGLGVLGLVSESLWMRILGFYWESNTRCFAFVTAATVAGLSAGSWTAGRWRSGRTEVGISLGVAALALGGAAVASPLAVHAFGTWERVATTFLLVGTPAAASGAAFVLLMGCFAGKGVPGRTLGFLSSANGAGAAAGPLILLAGEPWVSWPSQLLLVIAGGYAALIAVVAGRRAGLTGVALAGILGLCAWILSPAPTLSNFHPTCLDSVTMPFLRASLESTVAVTRDTRTGTEIVWIDRGFQGDTSPLGRLIPEHLGKLPCDLLGRPARRAMVIGLGTGVTLSAIAGSGAACVEVAELSRGVIEANRTILADVNGHVLEKTPVTVRHGDGRSFLLDAADPYDLIVADMIFPTVLGAGNLFSRDFFDLARRRLTPDGLFVHWMPCFLMSPEDLSAVTTAFLDVFPEGSAWVGYLSPGRLILGFVGGRINPKIRPEIAGRHALGPAEMRILADGALPIRDADPRLETRSRESGDGRFGRVNLRRVMSIMEASPDLSRRAWVLFAQAGLADDPARAAASYREAARVAPGATDAEFHLSSLSYERSLQAALEASECRDELVMLRSLRQAASYRDHGVGNLVLADVLVGRGRFEEALAELKKATAKSPRSLDAQLKLALLARDLGDPATARAAFETACALSSGQ